MALVNKHEFPKKRKPETKLGKKDTFKKRLDYFTERAGLTENKLALYAQIDQPELNKIANGRRKNVQIPTLVRICLALGLTLDEATDLMARRERALSPANETHDDYRRLIISYSTRKIDYQKYKNCPEKLLEEADNFLLKQGKEKLSRDI